MSIIRGETINQNMTMGWSKETIERFKNHQCCGTCKHCLDVLDEYYKDLSTAGLMRPCEMNQSREEVWLNSGKCDSYEDSDEFDLVCKILCRMG